MRDEAFGKVFKSVARLCGLDPARMSTELAESLAGWIEQRVTQAWEAFPWPELCPVEERYYAPAHDSGQTYALNDVVRVTADGATAYYTLLDAGSQATTPGTDEAVWQTTAPARFIDLDQGEASAVEGITPMGEVLGVWRDDPRKVRGPREVTFTVSGEGVWLDPHAPASVFVRFRKRPPQFTSTPWSAQTVYLPGDVVYSNGECYVAGTIVPTAFLTVTGTSNVFGLSLNGIYYETALTHHSKPVYATHDGNLAIFYDQLGTMAAQGWVAGVVSAEGSVGALSGDDMSSSFFANQTASSNPSSTVAAWTIYNDGPGSISGSLTVALTSAASNPADDPNWTRVRVPHVLANFARRSARADFLADDGQDDKSFAQERRAQEWLEEQFIAVTVTQRQTAKYTAHR